jgi:hypothetical protein
MFQLIDTDPAPDQVRRITFVPFLADGRCVLIEDPGGPALPAGDVQDGEPSGEELAVGHGTAFDHQPSHATGREVGQDARQAGRVTGIDDGGHVGEQFAGLGHGRA